MGELSAAILMNSTGVKWKCITWSDCKFTQQKTLSGEDGLGLDKEINFPRNIRRMPLVLCKCHWLYIITDYQKAKCISSLVTV